MLAKKGYTVRPPSSPDYVADIYRKEKPLAFYTRQDAILANPFAKVEEKHLERLMNIAKTTAISCGICTEKPYQEENAKEGENGVVRIKQHNGVVLSCKHHPLLGYVLSTYREDTAHGESQSKGSIFTIRKQLSRILPCAAGWWMRGNCLMKQNLPSSIPGL